MCKKIAQGAVPGKRKRGRPTKRRETTSDGPVSISIAVREQPKTVRDDRRLSLCKFDTTVVIPLVRIFGLCVFVNSFETMVGQNGEHSVKFRY